MKQLFVFVLVVIFSVANAQWSLEVSTGTSFHNPNTLTVYQEGHEPIVVNEAEYETRPWSNHTLLGLTENYYSVRLSHQVPINERWSLSREIELLHNKAYLTTNHPDIQHFELSDGLNSLLFNEGYVFRATERLYLVTRAGFGVSITAPATIIRGQQSGTRQHLGTESFYALAGVSGQVAGQVRYYLHDRFALTTEGKYVVAFTNNPIAGGNAVATFNGFHINVGILFGL